MPIVIRDLIAILFADRFRHQVRTRQTIKSPVFGGSIQEVDKELKRTLNIKMQVIRMMTGANYVINNVYSNITTNFLIKVLVSNILHKRSSICIICIGIDF